MDGGGMNDLEIAIQEIHRYNHFTPFEQGMGDSGFNGMICLFMLLL
jgi:hypothetical protein